jgi:hypothetical protein
MSIIVKNKDMERLIVSKPEIFSNKKLPVKLLYWLSRLQKDVETRFKAYANDQIKLYEKHCIRNNDGSIKYGANGSFHFPPEKTEIAAKELEEMREQDIEIGNYNKIEIDLNDKTFDGILSPNDLTVLEPFIKIVELQE